MPVIVESSYVPPRFLANGHLQTLLPALLRRVKDVTYQRERIPTPDGDFLDLDWSVKGWRRLAVLAHGLQGSSRTNHARGMVRALNRHGWDAVVWNARGCSGEPNRRLRFTHAGATEDLQTVLSHLTATRSYEELALIAYSLGGNLTLKYLGERGPDLNPRIRRSVVFSVPCDLVSSAQRLAGRSNRIYMWYFLFSLRRTVRITMKAMPGKIDDRDYCRIRTFQEFDDRYTAPLHGFADALDYWRQSSCRPVLDRISIPTLVVNARNDPFLAEPCFPFVEASENPHLHLEAPASGGHVGFITFNHGGEYWSEARTISFLS